MDRSTKTFDAELGAFVEEAVAKGHGRQTIALAMTLLGFEILYAVRGAAGAIAAADALHAVMRESFPDAAARRDKARVLACGKHH
jgi:hypothetical protein